MADDVGNDYIAFIAEMSQKTGRDFLELFLHPEELIPYENVWDMEKIEAHLKTEVILYRGKASPILTANAIIAVPDDDDDSNYWDRVGQTFQKGRNRVGPEFIGKVVAVLIRDRHALILRQRMAYPWIGGKYLGGEVIPTVQVKIIKQKPLSVLWVVHLTDVQIVKGDLLNTPGFERYDLRFSGATTLVDNRPNDAKS